MADEALMQKVLQGTCVFEQLPPLNKKVVRIFVSSTFSDTKEERNALMRNVYPKLAEYCRDRYGLEFQVVDMRWGVPEHASDHHTTTELCVDEIHKCQDVSVGPNFVALLGHKYGYRPIPTMIQQEVFAAMADEAKKSDDVRWPVVAQWYLRDENSRPPIYVLQPISSKIIDYNNMENSELRRAAQKTWTDTEKTLISTLRENAARAHGSGKVSQQQKHIFFMSVTENEVQHGIIQSRTEPRDTVVAIVRNIPDIGAHLDHHQAPRFCDTIPQEPRLDEEATKLLAQLKDEQLRQRLPENTQTRVEIEWSACGANVSTDNPKDVIVAKYAQKFIKGREMNITKHRKYLNGLCKDFQQKILKLINQGALKNSKSYDELTTEILQHMHLAKSRCEVFEGREDVIGEVTRYLADDTTLPLVLYGHSGCGKTSVISRIYQLLCSEIIGHASEVEMVDDDMKQMKQVEQMGKEYMVTPNPKSETEITLDKQTEELRQKKLAGMSHSATFETLDESNTGNRSVTGEHRGIGNESDLAIKELPGPKFEGDGLPRDVVEKIAEDADPTESDRRRLKHKKIAKSQEKPRPVILLRYLGTTPLTSNVQQLLVTACTQIARLYDVSWKEPDKFSDLSKDFKNLLKRATKQRPMVLLIDSIDQLMPVYGAYKVEWLPKVLPTYVKVVLSTLVEDYPVFNYLKQRYGEAGARMVEVLPLGDEVGMNIIRRWLDKNGRTITPHQETIVRQALEKCSLPLYARIAFTSISGWRCYQMPSVDDLETTVHGAITKLYQQMEAKLGAPLVKHCLAYLTASRYGLSEVELEHILSLDDEFLGSIYKFWRPPIRRVPPLLWTRVRNEINNYIVERSVDGILVLYWYHRQFIAATKARYLSDQEFQIRIHKILAEYFLGSWGNGKPKPFSYTEHQKKRFGLDTTKSAEDRKVPSQPYITESYLNGESVIRYNQRKISELPLHLFKSRQTDIMVKEVFFNYEWLYAKLRCTSARELLQEFELFMLSDKKLRKNYNLKILMANLQLTRPFLTRYPDSLPLELSGRLARYVGGHPLFTSLIKQCDSIGIKHCPLTPVITCFETADVGLKQNLHIRDTEPWHKGGAMTCSKDFRTLYIIDYDSEGVSFLSIWDIQTGDRISERTIDKQRQENTQETDVYFHIVLDKKETLLVAMYCKSFYVSELEKKNGYIDIININDCKVFRTYSSLLQKSDFYNSLHFQTENWVCARFGHKMPMISIRGDQADIPLKKPNYITQDEKTQVTIHPRLPNLTIKDGEQIVLGSTRQRMATVKNFETMEVLGELVQSENSVGLGIAHNDYIIALADLKGIVNVYSLTRSRRIKKIKKSMPLPLIDRITVTDVVDGSVHDAYHQKVVEASVYFSPNDKYLVTCYQSSWRARWEAFLWNVSAVKFVCRVAQNRNTALRYPVFTADSNFLVLTSLCAQKVKIIHSESGQIVKTYDIGHNIRDFVVSPKTPDIALLLQKDVMFLDVNSTELMDASRRSNLEQSEGRDLGSELLPREEQTTQRIQPKIVLMNGYANELDGIIRKCKDLGSRSRSAGVRRGSLGSASSIRHVALDSWETPDGEKLVQLHSRAQVVDTKEEEIKYSPKEGDVIVPAAGKADVQMVAPGTEETDWDSYIGAIDLSPNDKIVGMSNKTRLRVTSDTPGRMKIMTIPSIIRVSVLETHAVKARKRQKQDRGVRDQAEPKERLVRLRKLTVYQESIITISNKYLVTVKLKAAEEYINVYELETGKLIVTHTIKGKFGCAKFSFSEKMLFVATRDRFLRVYSGYNFLTELKIEPTKLSSVLAHIKDIMVLPANPRCVVMKYAKEGSEGMFLESYRYVELDSKVMSKPLEVKHGLQDVSRDGEIGICGQLKIYNLQTAQEERQIPFTSSAQNLNIQVRINNDKKLVVILDLEDDTLHVCRLSDNSADIVASCFTHSPSMGLTSSEMICLRDNGRVIVVRGPITAMMVIRESTRVAVPRNSDANFEPRGLKVGHIGRLGLESRPSYQVLLKKSHKLDYASDVTRARALLKSVKGPITESTKEKELQETFRVLPPIRHVDKDVTVPLKTSPPFPHKPVAKDIAQPGNSRAEVLPPITVGKQ